MPARRYNQLQRQGRAGAIKSLMLNNTNTNKAASVDTNTTKGSWNSVLGLGSYGVIHEFTNELGESKALKVNYVEQSLSFGGSYREIDILTRFAHPFIVKLEQVMFTSPIKIPNKKECKHENKEMKKDNIYMIFEKADFSLDDDQLDTFETVHKCITQILLALEYLHQNYHIHRDIKPGNIVYFKQKDIFKLIDFGMTKMAYPNCKSMSRAVTHAYRPPELFHEKDIYCEYGGECDIWSLGMTWVNLLEQIELEIYEDTSYKQSIHTIYSTIPRDDWTHREFKQHFKHQIKIRPTWETLLPNFHQQKEFLEIIKKMLKYIPSERWTATQLLDDPFFDPYREMINQTRNYKKPDILCPYVIQGEQSPERQLMINECELAMAQSPMSNALTLRMLFHSIDIIDRYIHWRIDQQIPRPDTLTSINRARCILYLMYKYFTIVVAVESYDNVFSKCHLTPSLEKEIKEFEIMLVRDILNYQIYRITPFEMAKDDEKLIIQYLEKYKDAEKIHGVLMEL